MPALVTSSKGPSCSDVGPMVATILVSANASRSVYEAGSGSRNEVGQKEDESVYCVCEVECKDECEVVDRLRTARRRQGVETREASRRPVSIVNVDLLAGKQETIGNSSNEQRQSLQSMEALLDRMAAAPGVSMAMEVTRNARRIGWSGILLLASPRLHRRYADGGQIYTAA
jgi:hypothetical protein